MVEFHPAAVLVVAKTQPVALVAVAVAVVLTVVLEDHPYKVSQAAPLAEVLHWLAVVVALQALAVTVSLLLLWEGTGQIAPSQARQ
jgi:hypothetical protein